MNGDDTAVNEPGIETVDSSHDSKTERDIDWEKAQEGTRLLLEAIGANPDEERWEATWKRRVPDVFETFSEGQRESAKPTLRTFDADGTDMVVKTGIPLYSICEHHLLPYHGHAHVAYRPGDSVVGLSKLVRYVRWQSRQPTMQEELTSDIAHGLSSELDAEAVIVEVEATHMCETMRGVETESTTTTRTKVGAPSAAERERFKNAVKNI